MPDRRRSILRRWALAAATAGIVAMADGASGAGPGARPAPASSSPKSAPGEQPASVDASETRMRDLELRADDIATKVLRLQARLRNLEDVLAVGSARPGVPAAPSPASGSLSTLESAVRALEERLGATPSTNGETAPAIDWRARLLLADPTDTSPFQRSTEYRAALLALADSLRGAGLCGTALEYYRLLAAQPSSTESARALAGAVDCEIRRGRAGAAIELVSHSRRGRGEPDPGAEALYVAAKAAFHRSDVPPQVRDREALAAFAAVPAPFEVAAAYHRGAILVRAGDLDGALREFESCDRLPAADARQRAQRELCWLAMARVQGERSNWKDAVYWYEQVPRDSPRHAEALFELASTYAKAGLADAGLRALATVPDPDPSSPLAAEVDLLRASLLARLRHYPEAIEVFGRVRQRYSPVRDETDRLLRSERDASRYLDRLASGGAAQQEHLSAIPPLVVAWVNASGGLGPALDFYARLQATRQRIADASTRAERLLALLSLDARAPSWLDEGLARARVEAEAARTLDGEVGELQAGAAGPGADEEARVEALRARAYAVLARAQKVEHELAELKHSGAGAAQTRVAEDLRRLADARGQLEAVQREARDVIGLEAHRRLQAARADIDRVVLRADRGVVEVALARTADAQARVQGLVFRRRTEDRLPLSAERRRAIAAELESRTHSIARAEQATRREAIAQLEDYVRSHPDDPVYTPEALSRLAELRYERANEGEGPETVAASKAKAGVPSRKSPPAPRGCAEAMELRERLASGFPAYKQKDAVYILVGYCLGQMGRVEDAITVYSSFLEAFPESTYAPEAWVRIGDLSFDEGLPGSLQRAAQAYGKMIPKPEHPLHAHALYMLGWTWYRADDFARAAEAFTRLLDYYVARTERTGEPPEGDLWAEALRYTAAAFADPGWDGVGKAREWAARAGSRPYVTPVLRRLGDDLFDQTRYRPAVEAYKLAIAADPMAADAPSLQARVVLSWSRERRPDEEAHERDVLVETYGETGAWWQRNQGTPKLANDVRALRASTLAAGAIARHARAQDLKKAGRLADALAEYRRADKAYANYLSAAPGAKDASDLAFARADCAFNANEFREAASLYERVRDDAGAASHREEAALDAVLSWEAEVARARKAGELEDRKLVLSKERHGEPHAPEPLPPPLPALVAASDAFVAAFPAHERAPSVAYASAELYYKYNQWDEARRRLEAVASRWPRSPVAGYAANLVIETHLAGKNWEGVEAASARLGSQVAEENAPLASSMKEFELAGRFQRALSLMEAQRFGDAVPLFEAVAAEAPRGELADKALYNAARSAEAMGRGDDAARTYERLQAEYPRSSYADEALFQLAYRSEETYEFDRAADRYLQVVQRYVASKQRKAALFNAGRTLESLQRYSEAADAFARYAEFYPDAPDAPEAQFHAAVLHEKAKEWTRVVQALHLLQKRFASSAKPELLVQSHLRGALAERALGHDRAATAGYAATVAEFARHALDPVASSAAAAAAAEAQFRLAEGELERFDRLTLPATTNAARLKKALDDKLAEMRKVAPLYDEVKRYKRPEWTIAAFYRQAYLLERLAQTLLDAPVPPEFKRPGREEYLAAYQDQLSAYALPFEEEAVQVYLEAMAAARELHVKNEWTWRIGESLARYRPKDFAHVREGKGRLRTDPLSAEPLFTGAIESGTAEPLAPGTDSAFQEGLARARAGEPERAAVAFERALALDRRAAWAAFDAGVAWERAGQPANAEAAYLKALEARPELAAALRNLSRLRVRAGRSVEVEADLRARLEHSPEGNGLRAALARLLVVQGRLDEAEREARRAIRSQEADVAGLLALALVFEARGQLEGARTVLEAAREKSPADPAVWNRLGLVELALGRSPQALECFRKATELEADYPEALTNYGEMLVEAGDHAGGARALEAAVRADPGSAVAWLDLGNARRGLRQFEDSRRAYERALAVDPRLLDARFDLGLLYLQGEPEAVSAVARLEAAVLHLDRFASDGGEDASLDQIRAEATSLLDKERKRMARSESQQSSPTVGGGPAASTAPAPGGPQ